MRQVNRTALMLSLAAVLATGACKRERPPEDMDLNATEDVVVNETPVNAVEALPPPANVAETEKAAPPPEVSDEVQMRDDADATGLTARLPEDAPSGGDNETQPAE